MEVSNLAGRDIFLVLSENDPCIPTHQFYASRLSIFKGVDHLDAFNCKSNMIHNNRTRCTLLLAGISSRDNHGNAFGTKFILLLELGAALRLSKKGNTDQTCLTL